MTFLSATQPKKEKIKKKYHQPKRAAQLKRNNAEDRREKWQKKDVAALNEYKWSVNHKSQEK